MLGADRLRHCAMPPKPAEGLGVRTALLFLRPPSPDHSIEYLPREVNLLQRRSCYRNRGVTGFHHFCQTANIFSTSVREVWRIPAFSSARSIHLKGSASSLRIPLLSTRRRGTS